MRKKNVEDFFPLSPMQQGMFFHSLYAPESGVYVEQVSCRLRGDLEVTAFERAWQRVVDRHSILRTAYIGEGLKEPVQLVQRRVKLPFEKQDWRAFPADEQEARLEAFLAGERRRGFELSQAPLMRLALMRVDEDAYDFVWTHHHILLDGWSLPPLLQEMFAFYEVFQRGQDLPLDPPRPYRDYIVWLKRQDMAQAEIFWRETLEGFTAPTPVVVGRPPESVAHLPERHAELEVRLSRETTEALQALTRQHHLTPNTLVQGAWAALLSRYSGEQDVVFGATVSGRPPDLLGSEFMVGLFINTLPVRVTVSPQATVSDWLKSIQERSAEMRQYEFSPLVQVQGWSDVPRGMPLFNSILVFENYPVESAVEGQGGSLAVENIRSIEQTNYPLTVVAGMAGELVLKISYDCRLFDDDTIRRMLDHLKTLLKGMLVYPEGLVVDLPLLTEAERRQLLVEWNATEADFPHDTTAHELFEAQVERTPDAQAVGFEDTALSYRELNRRANLLAHHLQARGVKPETLVGICVERALDMVVAVLGVLKAGGAYVPLDPAYPLERLAFMLQDSQVPLLLTQERLSPQLPEHDAQVVYLDAGWDGIAGGGNEENPVSGATAESLAYVIYTSGSTGRPKGTLLQHRGLCNLVHAFIPTFDLDYKSRQLQFAAFSFDASVIDIFSVLLAGATLCMAPQETLASVPDLYQLMNEQAITTVTLPPSVLALLPGDDLVALRTVASAGERCTVDVKARWAPGRRFVNGYGPTEATVGTTYYVVTDGIGAASSVPIGRPIDNARVYVLDARRRPVPIGVPGELYIGGVGVARGYLDRPDLTARRFISDPIVDDPDARIYKTGDLVRYWPDGNLEFLERVDTQVKLRGFRIELGEIESVLNQRADVQQAVVLVWGQEDAPQEKQLVAYLVPEDGQELGVGELRAYLREKLPVYMVPSAFVTLDVFPLLPNGKVNRRALPDPDGARMDQARAIVPPRDALETQLVQIWADVLNVQPISVKDDFFDLGGHSLLAVRVIAQVKKRFERDISLVDLFQEPTVERLASLLRRQEGGETLPSLVPLQPKGDKRPLYLVHPSGGSVHWYADLARHLGPDQPCYGLQAQGLSGEGALHTEIEEMAAHYVETIRTFQPQGPYLLSSWSMGVSVVFEMAQQLWAGGQEVAFMAILDQGPRLPSQEPEDDAAYLMEVFAKHLPLSLDHLRELDPAAQVAFVWEEARSANWIYPDVTLEQFGGFVFVLRAHTEAWRRYEPRPYAGRIDLFRADHQPDDGPLDDHMGWEEFAVAGVKIHPVPGDHLSMLTEPHVQALAAQLRVCLAELETVAILT